MLTETENSLRNSLVCKSRFPDIMLASIKKSVQQFMLDRAKGDDYNRFITWERKPNELVLDTSYAYDDILLPKTFDVAFEVAQPSKFIQTPMVINQVIINGWMPLNRISRGHKHICIVEFEKEVPPIFELLPLFGNELGPRGHFKLGICNKQDFNYA